MHKLVNKNNKYVYTDFKDLYKAHVQVVEGMYSLEPTVYMYVKGGEIDTNAGTMHLSVEQAKQVIHALNEFIKDAKEEYEQEL